MNWNNAGENPLYGWLRRTVLTLFLASLGLRHPGSRHFVWFELRRRLLYLPCNPWVISRHFLNARGEHSAQGYGETPLVTLRTVARHLQLTELDHLLELGMGTGRNCVWLAATQGCKATGVEQVPLFVNLANRLINKTKVGERLTFLCEDIFSLDMSAWQKVYVDATAMSESTILRLAMLCAGLPNGARVAIVNADLNRIMPERFQAEAAFPALFVWGWSDVRIFRVGPPEPLGDQAGE